jgi:hypothetical protein
LAMAHLIPLLEQSRGSEIWKLIAIEFQSLAFDI